MKLKRSLESLALAVLLCSCATTSVEKTWKSPSYAGGPVQKVAVLAISDDSMVRTGLENRLARQIGAHGQAAITTVKLLSLPQVKQDKAGAAARLRQEGADSVLIMRLLDRTTYDRQVRTGSTGYMTPMITTRSPSRTWA